jgi:hypothetical protein
MANTLAIVFYLQPRQTFLTRKQFIFKQINTFASAVYNTITQVSIFLLFNARVLVCPKLY